MNTPEIETETPESPEGSDIPDRRPKIANRYSDAANWELLGMSETLLRCEPNKPLLWPVPDGADSAAIQRMIISYAFRMRQKIPEYKLQTAVCLINWVETEEIDGKTVARDRVARAIRIVVTCNPLFDAWLARSRLEDEEARRKAAELEAAGPRPRGRPVTKPALAEGEVRKPSRQNKEKPEGAEELPKRPRGRPPMTAEEKALKKAAPADPNKRRPGRPPNVVEPQTGQLPLEPTE